MSLVSHLLILCVLLSVLNTQDDYPEDAKGPRDPGLVREVEPNFNAIKGLVCYQCKSDTRQRQPLCDKSMFNLATKEEKYNMSLQCPHYQGAYCFTMVTQKSRYVETVRGCSGPTDKNGYPMKTGCMHQHSKGVLLCLCDTKFCNKANSNLPKISVLLLITFNTFA